MYNNSIQHAAQYLLASYQRPTEASTELVKEFLSHVKDGNYQSDIAWHQEQAHRVVVTSKSWLDHFPEQVIVEINWFLERRKNIRNIEEIYRTSNQIFFVKLHLGNADLLGDLLDLSYNVKELLPSEPIIASLIKPLVNLLVDNSHPFVISSDRVLINDQGEVYLECQLPMNRRTAVGTPFWISPEEIQGHPRDGRSCVWSIGIFLWELLFGEPPYLEFAPVNVLTKYLTQEFTWPEEDLSPECNEFLSMCLQRDPGQRPSPKDLVQHRFLNQWDDIGPDFIKAYFSCTRHRRQQDLFV